MPATFAFPDPEVEVWGTGRPQREFLLLESDLVYERRALEAVCRTPGDTLLVSGWTT